MEQYQKLNEKLMAALKEKNLGKIEESLDQIDKSIPREKIPTEDRELHAKARAMLGKEVDEKGIY